MPVYSAPRQYRKNVTPVSLLTLNYVITFDMPLMDTDYEVYFQSSLNTGLGVINKTTTGFTMVLGVAVAGSITSIAIANHL